MNTILSLISAFYVYTWCTIVYALKNWEQSRSNEKSKTIAAFCLSIVLTREYFVYVSLDVVPARKRGERL